MKVGITGGNGFIGSWIQDELRRRGHTVLVLDHRNNHDGMLGDVRDSTIVYELAAHVDGIIHLAAILGTAETIDVPHPSAETNVLGSLNVFEAATRYKIPVVNASVGNSGIGRGTYCVTKRCVEDFVHMYREDRGLDVISVRPMNAYGPRQSAPAPYGSAKVRKIVPSFVCSALSGHPIEMYGGGTQVSDAVHVYDVARSFVAALETAAEGKVPDFVIDIGNTIPSTVVDVAQAVVENVPGAVLKDVPMRAGEPHGGPMSTFAELTRVTDAVLAATPDMDPRHVRRVIKQLGTVVCADTSTLDFIGINADDFIPLSDGIASTVDWFRENRGVTWR